MGSIDLGEIVVQYICLLFSLCVHEAAHAAMADRCGDPSARFLGRITLNPLPHIDPLGTVILPLLMMTTNVPLFGWAKPVPFNPRNLHNIRRDPMLIALAGPASNFLVALATALLLRVIAYLAGALPDMQFVPILIVILKDLIIINLLLMCFNLIPIPPLDGHHFLPDSVQKKLEILGPFGVIIAMMLIVRTPFFQVPLHFLYGVLYLISFYGTPLWGVAQ